MPPLWSLTGSALAYDRGEDRLITIVAIILTAAALLAVGYPLLQRRYGASFTLRGDGSRIGDLSLRKESLYATIKELDFDFKTGKLSSKDYGELREKYRERALALLLEMERGGRFSGLEERLEEEIKGRRNIAADGPAEAGAGEGNGPAGAFRCPQCGEGCSEGDTFCPYCGGRLSDPS